MPRPYQTQHDAKHLAGPLIFLAPLLSLFLPLIVSGQARPLILSAQQQTNPNSTVKNDKDIRVLEPGKSIERELTGGELHSYRIMLAAAEYMHVEVDQQGVDVVLTLRGPDGAQLTEMDGIERRAGTEELSWEAGGRGEYAFEVRASQNYAPKGRYEVRLRTAAASGRERVRIAAERLFIEARRAQKEQKGEWRERAVKAYEGALEKWREAGDRKWEGLTLYNFGFFYIWQSQFENAQRCFEQALAIRRELKDRLGEGETVRGLGLVYDYLSQNEKARDYYEQALTISREINNRSGEGDALFNLGLLYQSLSQYEKAREYLEQALTVSREIKDRGREAYTVNNLGEVYVLLSQYGKAQEYFEQSLAIKREIKDRLGEGQSVGNLGYLYSYLGQYDKAREYYEQSLAIARETRQRWMEGGNLGNLGELYLKQRHYEKAREYFDQVLAIFREIKDRFREGEALNLLGEVYRNLRQYEKAREYYEQALALRREIQDKQGAGGTLLNLGVAYYDQGQHERAEAYFEQALAITREIKDKFGEGAALHRMMLLNKSLHGPRLAIFYGKQAINTYQEIRSNIQGLEKQSQQSFLQSKEETYRTLADLLISEARLPEAQQVLGMLKEEEYFDFVRRDNNEAPSLKGRATFTPKEAEWEKHYREIADRLAEMGRQRGELMEKQSRTREEEEELTKLEGDLRFAQEAFQKYLDQLFIESGKSEMAKERVFQLQESQGLMEDLRELGSGVVALYTLVGQEKYRVILITPDIQKAYEYPIKSADLARKVLAYREVLENTRLDPLPLAQELYRILIGPVAKDLKNVQAQTLMWSLDSVLRYVPIAALHDGRKYMVEQYRNEVFTPASNSRLKDLPSTKWKALGLGVSKRTGGFGALPAVPEELHGIIREPDVTTGSAVMDGKVLLDEAFTDEAMRMELRRHYPLVHIASHFRFQPGNETDSFLLLGDGKHLSLTEIKTSVNLFGGVELLTLSACETATGSAGADGKEVEGFAVLAQRQGARAVIASLWPVADRSTRLLMEEFYRARDAQPRTSKAEALRQAQLSLLKGAGEGSGASTQQRGVRVGADSKTKGEKEQGQRGLAGESSKVAAIYTHPFYWAPFVLIGNWR